MFYNNPLFGVTITLVVYMAADMFQKKTKWSIANPLLLSMIILMGMLTVLKIPLQAYQVGGAWITFLIKPATVALAIPLYHHSDKLLKNIKAIAVGVLTGVFTSIISVLVMSKLFGFELDLQKSLISKSITTPIGIEVTNQLGGIVPIAIAAIIITGIFGALVGPFVLNMTGIRDKTAFGIAMGTSAHVIGTSKALELDNEIGAMSAVAIPIAGIVTVLLTPLVSLFI